MSDLFNRLVRLRSATERQPWLRDRLGNDELAILRNATSDVLEIETGELASSQRLAYASANDLEYATTDREAEQLWQAGKTAIVQSLQMTPGYINSLCAAVEVHFQKRVSCSAYISSPRSQTFSMHTDEWDAFIIQIEGEKIFIFDDGSGAEIEEVLVPGDVVYMPQGLLHRAFSKTDSIHLSLNLLPFPPRV